MSMIKLMGWTVEQWADAAAYCKLRNGELPAADLNGARTVQIVWRTNRVDEPWDHKVIAHWPYEEEWARDMFNKVAYEIRWSYEPS